MIIREWVFDRINDSTDLLKKNFVGLFVPMFLYNFVSIVIIWTISQYYFMWQLAWLKDVKDFDIFTFLNNSTVQIALVIGVFLFILYLLLFVIIYLGLLNSIKIALKWEKINMIDNLKYWLLNFNNSMKTYWYIFAYIALIPSFIFIIWWVLFNITYFVDWLDLLKSIWLWFIWLWLILFAVFAVYRWTKSMFWVFSAVNSQDYSKENFYKSVNFTNNNWWRIVWNLFLLWILISLITSIISWIISLFSFWFWWGGDFLQSAITAWYNHNPEEIKNLIENYLTDFSLISEILWNLVNNTLTTFWTVFTIVFTYILYLRLWIEYKNNNLNKEFNNINNNNLETDNNIEL